MCLWNIAAIIMLLNSLAVFQLLRYARVLTVANFASCDYFSYLSRCEWTNMLKYPLWWCWWFFSEAQQSDALNNEMSGLTRWRTHSSLMAYEKQTFVFLLAGTFFSFLVTFSMVTSARMVFGFVWFFFVYSWSCVLRWIWVRFKEQDYHSYSLAVLRSLQETYG